MSAIKPPHAMDPNPRHPREDLHRFINELNVKYNLGVPIPDPGLSPSKRKEQETPATRLYNRLEVHFYQRGLEILQQLMKEFDSEARQSCSQWVRKPRGDPDTLPASGNSPLAFNQVQRECLQSVFLKVLERVPPKRAFSRTRSGPAAFSMEKSTSDQPKRAAEAEMTKAPIKRSKLAGQAGSAAQVPGPAVLSRPGHLFAAPNKTSEGHRHGSTGIEHTHPKSFEELNRSTTYSASTASKASSHTVFSHTKLGSSTQETVEASSQEQRRTLSTSQDQFLSTPITDDVLHKSFDDYEASFDPRLRDTRPKNGPCPLTQTTVYSCPPSSAMEEALRSFSETETKPQGEQAVAEAVFTPQFNSIFGQDIWPAFPGWLQSAPFYVAWEVLRIGAHMRVDLSSVSLTYSSQWTDQKVLRSVLGNAFQGKPLPAASDPDAWAIATSGTSAKYQHIVFAASLEFAAMKSDSSCFLHLKLQPLKLDKPHRLGRKFGADRFLELLVPSPDSSNLPSLMKNKPFYDELVNWLTQQPHVFCGRCYRPFYLKSGGQRKPLKHLQVEFGPDPKPVYTDRVYLFAEHGIDIAKMPVESMIGWALDLKGSMNDSQPVLKLFQRLALVLSKTTPTVLFEPNQIKHQSQDLLSTDGKKVMNDGVGRMSRKVAKMIQTALGLSLPPCAVQGRLGSAKGMWVVDVNITDTSDEIWIETYPSQRKWVLKSADQEHRTLEIRSWAPEKLRSASLNLQFLPVLEDRAIDKRAMRKTISKLLEDNLRQELGDQRKSLESPIQFQKWIAANSAHRLDRLNRGHVPFQGGLPREDEEIMACMLNAGFDPWRNKFLNDMAYNAQRRMCEKLSKKLNIKIGCSAYFFMVIDFSHVLEEGEVHIAFADRFRAEVGDWEGTMVHGKDVLVARSPAHFPSDIQRVRAVFKPELAHLQNVIVFSAKGNTPLAEKLSGGDYDGDQCFCVWDDRVVSNFANANDEAQPDLRNYYRQDRIQLRQLLSTHKEEYKAAIGEMIEKCFAFNLTKDMLGQVTNYKERLCYARGNVHDEVARELSALLSTLVDAPKQGIEFDSKDFKAFKQSLKLPDQLEEPLYKKDRQPSEQHFGHILDHLKFRIAQPTIDEELSNFYAEEKKAAEVVHWDKDLTAKHYDEWERDASESAQAVLCCLKEDINEVLKGWNVLLSDDAVSYAEKVQRTYDSWQGIQPSQGVTQETLKRLHRGHAQTSEWALLKASTTFKVHYQSRPRFVWQMAGWHLCFIKWLAVSEMQASVGRMPAVLTPTMYTITKVDSRAVNHLIELQTGLAMEGNEGGDEEDDA